MQQYARPQLTLDQAYQAAFLWLDHIGEPPGTISEPADGVIELRTDKYLARIRWSRSPINQAAVLAILRVEDDPERRALFSATGYTPGAVSLADTQGVALFTIDAAGNAIPENAHASALMPATQPEPPFAPHEMAHAEPRVPNTDDTSYDLSDWIECPNCGTTHHKMANFCRTCGTNLHGGPSLQQDEAETPPPAEEQPRAVNVAPPPVQLWSVPDEDPANSARATRVPPAEPGQPTLRCRTCGSHDIELIHPQR